MFDMLGNQIQFDKACKLLYKCKNQKYFHMLNILNNYSLSRYQICGLFQTIEQAVLFLEEEEYQMGTYHETLYKDKLFYENDHFLIVFLQLDSPPKELSTEQPFLFWI